MISFSLNELNEFFIKTPLRIPHPEEQFKKYLTNQKKNANPIEKPFQLEWQYISEMEQLRKILARQGSTLYSDMLFIYNAIRKLDFKMGIEVGAWYGYGIYYISNALKRNNGQLISIDINPLRARLRSLILFTNNTEIIKGKSTDILPRFKNENVDFVFLDGDHTYNAVCEELQILSNFKNLKAIFMHDMYQNSGPNRAWADNCEKFGLTKNDMFIMDDSYYFFDKGSKWIRRTGATLLKNKGKF